MEAKERETITQCIEMLSYFEKDNIPKIPESHRISMVINGLRGLVEKHATPTIKITGPNGEKLHNPRLELIEQRAWELYLPHKLPIDQCFFYAEFFTSYAVLWREGQVNNNEEEQP